MPFPLSAISDEIADDLPTGLRTLRELDIREVEVREVDGSNVADFTLPQAQEFRRLIDEAGLRCSGLAAPVGKSPISREASYERDRLAHLFEVAGALGTKRIRVFSYYPPKGEEDLDALVPEVISRLRVLAGMAQKAGIQLVLENEFGIVGDVPARVARILEGVDSAALRFAWDPQNFLHSGVRRPFDESWPVLARWTTCCHVKDAKGGEGMVVAGQGDAQWPQIIPALAARGGLPLVMEPHLKHAGHSRGFSGPDLFASAVRALRGLLPPAA